MDRLASAREILRKGDIPRLRLPSPRPPIILVDEGAEDTLSVSRDFIRETDEETLRVRKTNEGGRLDERSRPRFGRRFVRQSTDGGVELPELYEKRFTRLTLNHPSKTPVELAESIDTVIHSTRDIKSRELRSRGSVETVEEHSRAVPPPFFPPELLSSFRDRHQNANHAESSYQAAGTYRADMILSKAGDKSGRDYHQLRRKIGSMQGASTLPALRARQSSHSGIYVGKEKRIKVKSLSATKPKRRHNLNLNIDTINNKSSSQNLDLSTLLNMQKELYLLQSDVMTFLQSAQQRIPIPRMNELRTVKGAGTGWEELQNRDMDREELQKSILGEALALRDYREELGNNPSSSVKWEEQGELSSSKIGLGTERAIKESDSLAVAGVSDAEVRELFRTSRDAIDLLVQSKMKELELSMHFNAAIGIGPSGERRADISDVDRRSADDRKEKRAPAAGKAGMAQIYGSSRRNARGRQGRRRKAMGGLDLRPDGAAVQKDAQAEGRRERVRPGVVPEPMRDVVPGRGYLTRAPKMKATPFSFAATSVPLSAAGGDGSPEEAQSAGLVHAVDERNEELDNMNFQIEELKKEHRKLMDELKSEKEKCAGLERKAEEISLKTLEIHREIDGVDPMFYHLQQRQALYQMRKKRDEEVAVPVQQRRRMSVFAGVESSDVGQEAFKGQQEKNVDHLQFDQMAEDLGSILNLSLRFFGADTKINGENDPLARGLDGTTRCKSWEVALEASVTTVVSKLVKSEHVRVFVVDRYKPSADEFGEEQATIEGAGEQETELRERLAGIREYSGGLDADDEGFAMDGSEEIPERLTPLTADALMNEFEDGLGKEGASTDLEYSSETAETSSNKPPLPLHPFVVRVCEGFRYQWSVPPLFPIPHEEGIEEKIEQWTRLQEKRAEEEAREARRSMPKHDRGSKIDVELESLMFYGAAAAAALRQAINFDSTDSDNSQLPFPLKGGKMSELDFRDGRKYMDRFYAALERAIGVKSALFVPLMDTFGTVRAVVSVVNKAHHPLTTQFGKPSVSERRARTAVAQPPIAQAYNQRDINTIERLGAQLILATSHMRKLARERRALQKERFFARQLQLATREMLLMQDQTVALRIRIYERWAQKYVASYKCRIWLVHTNSGEPSTFMAPSESEQAAGRRNQGRFVWMQGIEDPGSGDLALMPESTGSTVNYPIDFDRSGVPQLSKLMMEQDPAKGRVLTPMHETLANGGPLVFHALRKDSRDSARSKRWNVSWVKALPTEGLDAVSQIVPFRFEHYFDSTEFWDHSADDVDCAMYHPIYVNDSGTVGAVIEWIGKMNRFTDTLALNQRFDDDSVSHGEDFVEATQMFLPLAAAVSPSWNNSFVAPEISNSSFTSQGLENRSLASDCLMHRNAVRGGMAAAATLAQNHPIGEEVSSQIRFLTHEPDSDRVVVKPRVINELIKKLLRGVTELLGDTQRSVFYAMDRSAGVVARYEYDRFTDTMTSMTIPVENFRGLAAAAVSAARRKVKQSEMKSKLRRALGMKLKEAVKPSTFVYGNWRERLEQESSKGTRIPRLSEGEDIIVHSFCDAGVSAGASSSAEEVAWAGEIGTFTVRDGLSEVAACLVLYLPPGRKCTRHEVRVLGSMALIAANRHRNIEEVANFNRHVFSANVELNDAICKIGRVSTVSQLILHATELVRALTRAEEATVFFLQKKYAKRILTAKTRGEGAKIWTIPMTQNRRLIFPLGKGIAGSVARNGNPIVIEGDDDPRSLSSSNKNNVRRRFDARVDTPNKPEMELKSLIAVPFFNHGFDQWAFEEYRKSIRNLTEADSDESSSSEDESDDEKDTEYDKIAGNAYGMASQSFKHITASLSMESFERQLEDDEDSDGSSQRTREFRNLRYLRHAINEQTRPKSFFETVLAAASAESRQQSVTSSQEISDIDRSERGVGDASTGKNNKESSPDKAAGEKHVSFDTSSPRAGGPPKLDRRGTEIRLRKELREEKWRKRRSDDEDNAGEVEIIGVAVVVNKQGEQSFSIRDDRILRAFSRQVGLCFEHLKRVDRTAEQKKLLPNLPLTLRRPLVEEVISRRAKSILRSKEAVVQFIDEVFMRKQGRRLWKRITEDKRNLTQFVLQDDPVTSLLRSLIQGPRVPRAPIIELKEELQSVMLSPSSMRESERERRKREAKAKQKARGKSGAIAEKAPKQSPKKKDEDHDILPDKDMYNAETIMATQGEEKREESEDTTNITDLENLLRYEDVEKRAVALLSVKAKRDGMYTEADKSTLAAFNFLASISIANVCRFEKAKGAMGKSQILVEMLRPLFSEHRPEQLARNVIDFSRVLTHAEHCIIFSVDPKLRDLDVFGTSDDYLLSEPKFPFTRKIYEHCRHAEPAPPIDGEIISHVATTGRVLNVTDIMLKPKIYRKIPHTDSATLPVMEKQDNEEDNGVSIKNLLAVPIVTINGEVIGVLQLTNKISNNFDDEGEEAADLNALVETMSDVSDDRNDEVLQAEELVGFTMEDEEWAQVLAGIAGVAIENAASFERAQLIHQCMTELQVDTSTREAEKMIVNYSLSIFDADLAAFYISDRDTQHLRLVARELHSRYYEDSSTSSSSSARQKILFDLIPENLRVLPQTIEVASKRPSNAVIAALNVAAGAHGKEWIQTTAQGPIGDDDEDGTATQQFLLQRSTRALDGEELARSSVRSTVTEESKPAKSAATRRLKGVAKGIGTVSTMLKKGKEEEKKEELNAVGLVARTMEAIRLNHGDTLTPDGAQAMLCFPVHLRHGIHSGVGVVQLIRFRHPELRKAVLRASKMSREELENLQEVEDSERKFKAFGRKEMIFADILSTHAGFLMQGATLTDQAESQKLHVRAIMEVANLIQQTTASSVLQSSPLGILSDEEVAGRIAKIICNILDVDRCYFLIHEQKNQCVLCVAFGARKNREEGAVHIQFPRRKEDLALLRQDTLQSLPKRKHITVEGEEMDAENPAVSVSESEGCKSSMSEAACDESQLPDELLDYEEYLKRQKPQPQYSSVGVVGKALRSGKAVTVSDVYQTDAKSPDGPLSSGNGVRTTGGQEGAKKAAEFVAELDERQKSFRTDHMLCVPVPSLSVGSSGTGPTFKAVLDVRRGRDLYESLREGRTKSGEEAESEKEVKSSLDETSAMEEKSVRSVGSTSARSRNGREDDAKEGGAEGGKTTAADHTRLPFSSSDEEALQAIARVLSMWPALRFGIPIRDEK